MKANVLLEGKTGFGKTTALRTLLHNYVDEAGKVQEGAGLDTFIAALDPGLEASLGPNLCPHEHGAHWHYIASMPLDAEAAMAWTRLMNTMTTEQLTKVSDPKRGDYTQFMQLYELTTNFICHGCDAEFGSIFQMGDDCAIAVDSLTSLTKIAKCNHVGGRPIVSWPEIYTIQSSIEMFMDLWWGSTSCTSILVAHVERETSPLTGLSYIATATIGNKLAPKLDQKPDDVILAVRDGGRYLWDTAEKGMELKSRHLPIANNLPADFRQMFKR